MATISKVPFSRFCNDEHSAFHSEAKSVFLAHPFEDGGLLAPYLAAVDAETGAMLEISKSALTAQLAAADEARDQILAGLGDAARAGLNHFRADCAEAAARIKIIFDSHGGLHALASRPYAEETAGIAALVQQAEGAARADFDLLELNGWVAELKSRNEAFAALSGARYSEETSKGGLSMKAARTESDRCYRALAARLEALMLLNGEGNYAALARELSVRAEKYSLVLAQRLGRAGKHKEE